jgi:hypothetical protein
MSVGGKPAPVLLRVRAAKDGVKGSLTLPVPAGWKVDPASIPVELAKAGDETTALFSVTPPKGAGAAALLPALEVDGTSWSIREDVIDYPHIPMQIVLQPARLRVSIVLEVPAGLIGYVRVPGTHRGRSRLSACGWS